MLKFIHTADIHLDSPLLGLQQYEGAPVEQIRGATRLALENLVELAIAECVAFVLIAGDLYDGEWKDYNTGLYFANQMSRLREAGIRVCLAAGNHDAASQITRSLRMPDNVTAFSTRKPETVVLEDCGVAVHGQGFSSREVTDDLSAAYPAPTSGLFNIGLLHTSADGRQGHEPYAPCSLPGLLARGYQYWALGHVHRREVLHQEPWVLFPGNLQGRHVRETGPKGCSLVTLRDEEVLAVDHRHLDVLRWSVCEVNATGAATGEELVDRTLSALAQQMAHNPDLPLAVRIQLIGPCQAHGAWAAHAERLSNDIRAGATDISGGNIWVEKIKAHTRPEREVFPSGDDALSGLLQTILTLDADELAAAEFADEFRDLAQKLPAEFHAQEDAVDLEDPDVFREVIGDVKALLLARLLNGEAAS